MSIRVYNVTAQALFSSTTVARGVTDTITFTEEPFARKIRVAQFTVQLLQSEGGSTRSLSDNISLSEIVSGFLVQGERSPASNTIELADYADYGIDPTPVGGGTDWYRWAGNTIEFTQVAFAENFTKALVQSVGIHDSVGYCFGAPWAAISVTDTITLEDRVSTIEPISIIDTIVFTETVSTLGNNLEDFLDLVQSVSVGKGQDLVSTITLTQDIDSKSDFLRTVQDANIVEHAMTYFVDDGCNRKIYAQFSGEGSADSIPDQRLIFDANMALEATTADDVLILRNPETDDGDRLGFNRVNRETRGGELNVFGDPVWAKVNTLLFTIVALSDGKNCPDVINETLDFFQTYLGQEIVLHDHTGTSWRGVVTTPNERAVEDAEGWWTLSFEFQGEAEPGSVPQSVMNITDTLTMNADWNRPLIDTMNITDSVSVTSLHQIIEQDLGLSDSIGGSTFEHTILDDDFTAGSAVDLHGTSPDTGVSTWSANTEYQDDGTIVNPIRGGGYYPFTPVNGTFYLLEVQSAAVVTYEDGFNCIWGYYEDVTPDTDFQGPAYDGTINPTAAKAVHLQRNIPTADRDRAYRLGSDSNGAQHTKRYTDATLRDVSDNVLDLRIELDTTGGAGNWTARWLAKGVIASTWDEVGPETKLLSENVGAVGFSTDSNGVELTTDRIILTEQRSIG
jgi:hypothetical protein